MNIILKIKLYFRKIFCKKKSLLKSDNTFPPFLIIDSSGSIV